MLNPASLTVQPGCCLGLHASISLWDHQSCPLSLPRALQIHLKRGKIKQGTLRGSHSSDSPARPPGGSSGDPPLQRSTGGACSSLRMVRRFYSFSETDQLREHRGEEDEALRVAWGGGTALCFLFHPPSETSSSFDIF